MQPTEKTIWAYRISGSLLSLLIPGSGFAVLGKWKTAFLFTLGFFGILIILAETRLITSPLIFFLFVANYMSATAISAIFCLWLEPKTSSSNLKNISSATGYIALVSAAIIISISFSKLWLGLHVYFIPSISMQPTLQPGQFVIVDTLAYKSSPPQTGDVIVFEQSGNWLIKRITDWPITENQKQNTWYVMGDNRDYSQDSRYFGGIHSSKIDGKAVFILLSLNNNHEISGPTFKKIP